MILKHILDLCMFVCCCVCVVATLQQVVDIYTTRTNSPMEKGYLPLYEKYICLKKMKRKKNENENQYDMTT